jgi:hypothetical protein
MEVIKNCGVCHSPAKLMCSSCRNIFYCSKEHQKNDWKAHKTNCLASKKNDNSATTFSSEAKASAKGILEMNSSEVEKQWQMALDLTNRAIMHIHHGPLKSQRAEGPLFQELMAMMENITQMWHKLAASGVFPSPPLVKEADKLVGSNVDFRIALNRI